MKVFRKKYLVSSIIGVAIFSLVNVSVQFGQIIDCFPGMYISYLLAEELLETESETEKGTETVNEFDFTLTKHANSSLSTLIEHAVGVFFHTTSIPPHPHFEKDTPPPKG
jgi:hypothetical protein